MHTYYVLQYAYKLIYVQRIIDCIFYKTGILIVHLKCHLVTCVVSYPWGSYPQVPTWEPGGMMTSANIGKQVSKDLHFRRTTQLAGGFRDCEHCESKLSSSH